MALGVLAEYTADLVVQVEGGVTELRAGLILQVIELVTGFPSSLILQMIGVMTELTLGRNLPVRGVVTELRVASILHGKGVRTVLTAGVILQLIEGATKLISITAMINCFELSGTHIRLIYIAPIITFCLVTQKTFSLAHSTCDKINNFDL